ncbi:MAG: hypothetical protein QOH28_50 [Actinomycetota bacterium]|nr:hypothetical protein [Actinomycetota bacterium]
MPVPLSGTSRELLGARDRVFSCWHAPLTTDRYAHAVNELAAAPIAVKMRPSESGVNSHPRLVVAAKARVSKALARGYRAVWRARRSCQPSNPMSGRTFWTRPSRNRSHGKVDGGEGLGRLAVPRPIEPISAHEPAVWGVFASRRVEHSGTVWWTIDTERTSMSTTLSRSEKERHNPDGSSRRLGAAPQHKLPVFLADEDGGQAVGLRCGAVRLDDRALSHQPRHVVVDDP